MQRKTNLKLGKTCYKRHKLSAIRNFPKDTQSDPNKTLRSAIELENGICCHRAVFYENIIYLNELEILLFYL